MTVWMRRGGSWTSLPLAASLGLGPSARVVRFMHHGTPRGALVAPAGSGLTLNGFPPLGVAVLRHRDDITLGGTRFVFSAFASAEPAPFTPDAPGTRCARCNVPLNPGEIVAQCGACSAPQHQHGKLTCATYDEKCGACGRSRTEIAWSPALLDDEETNHAPC
jgi:hypothetical protein